MIIIIAFKWMKTIDPLSMAEQALLSEIIQQCLQSSNNFLNLYEKELSAFGKKESNFKFLEHSYFATLSNLAYVMYCICIDCVVANQDLATYHIDTHRLPILRGGRKDLVTPITKSSPCNRGKI